MPQSIRTSSAPSTVHRRCRAWRGKARSTPPPLNWGGSRSVGAAARSEEVASADRRPLAASPHRATTVDMSIFIVTTNVGCRTPPAPCARDQFLCVRSTVSTSPLASSGPRVQAPLVAGGGLDVVDGDPPLPAAPRAACNENAELHRAAAGAEPEWRGRARRGLLGFARSARPCAPTAPRGMLRAPSVPASGAEPSVVSISASGRGTGRALSARGGWSPPPSSDTSAW